MSLTIFKNNKPTVIVPSPEAEVFNVSDQYLGRRNVEEEQPFKLDETFLAKFRGLKPKFGFNGLGEFVFYRTYSRLKPDGTKETFLDTAQRVVEGCYEIQRRHCRQLHIPWDYDKAQPSAQEMFQRMWDFKFLPPGRGLWMMGTKFMWERGSAALNNCAFVSTSDLSESDPSEPFCFMMDMAMLGVGVGFDTKGAGKILIRQPNPEKVRTFAIPDSREGWVDSVRHLIRSYTITADSGIVEFDYNLIRKAGDDIKGFGGKASGPGILTELHALIRAHLEGSIGEYLNSVDITDLMNYIGRCVVAGNVRRCLPRGTLIHLKRGLVPIENVQVGDLVLTSDGFHPVSENVHQGIQRVVTINTQMGPFRCTDRHEMAILTGFGEYAWVRARELSTGDRLVFVNECIPGVDTVLPGYSDKMKQKSTFLVPGLTTDIAWFLGIIHGDGYVYPGRLYKGRRHHGASVMIPVNRDEYHDAITEKINIGFSFFGYNKPGEQPSDDNCRKIRVISKHLAHYLYKNIKQAKTPLDVPECVRLGRVEIRAAYLAGLLDSDGSVKNRPTTLITSVYRDFLRQVQAVYSSLGIPVRLKLKKEADSDGQAKWELSLVDDFVIEKFRKIIQPYAVKKLRELKNHSSHGYGYPASWVEKANIKYRRHWSPQQDQMTQTCAVLCDAKVRNLVPIEVLNVVDEGITCDTYDLSVADRSELVAQGLLVHNTAQIAFGDADDDLYCSAKNPTNTLIPEDLDAWFRVTNKLYAQKKMAATLRDFDGSGIPNERLSPAVRTWNALNHHRWASNNSIFAKTGMDYRSVGQQIGVNGEPGILWLNNIKDYGRIIDGYQPGVDGRVAGSNPCVEQSLESYELCCLVESFPANHDSAEDYMRTLKFAYLYAKTVTLLPTHNRRSNQVMLRNRRIGLSQSGIVQAFAKFGRRVVLKDFCDAGFNEIRRWDQIYADWLCVPKSIKVTSVKPSGTVSLVVGATPGIHHPEASTYWRLVRVSKSSILLKILEKAGYKIEPDLKDAERTAVVYFAISDPRVRAVGDVTIWEQMQNAVDYQRYWADNQVSCTIKFKPHEAADIPRVLEAYEDQLKGIAFLPHEDHGYQQAPYIPCASAEVEEYNTNIKDADYSEYVNEAVGSVYCDSEKCTSQST